MKNGSKNNKDKKIASIAWYGITDSVTTGLTIASAFAPPMIIPAVIWGAGTNFLGSFAGFEHPGWGTVTRDLMEGKDIFKDDAQAFYKESISRISNPNSPDSLDDRLQAIDDLKFMVESQSNQLSEMKNFIADDNAITRAYISEQTQYLDDLNSNLDTLKTLQQSTNNKVDQIQTKVNELHTTLDQQAQAFQAFEQKYQQDQYKAQIQTEFKDMQTHIDKEMNSRFGQLFDDGDLQDALSDYHNAIYDESSYSVVQDKKQAVKDRMDDLRDQKDMLETGHSFMEGVQLAGTVCKLLGLGEESQKLLGTAQGGMQILAGIAAMSNPLTAALYFAGAASTLQDTFGGKKGPSQLEMINELLVKYTEMIIKHMDKRFDRLEMILSGMTKRIDKQFVMVNFNIQKSVELLVDVITNAADNLMQHQEYYFQDLQSTQKKLITYARAHATVINNILNKIEGQARTTAANKLLDFEKELPNPEEQALITYKEAKKAQQDYFRELNDWMQTRIHSDELVGESMSKADLAENYQLMRVINNHNENSWYLNSLLTYLSVLDKQQQSTLNKLTSFFLSDKKQTTHANPLLWSEGLSLLSNLTVADTFAIDHKNANAVKKLQAQAESLRDSLIALRKNKPLVSHLFTIYQEAVNDYQDHVYASMILPVYPPASRSPDKVDDFFIRTVQSMDVSVKLIDDLSEEKLLSDDNSFESSWTSVISEADGLESYADAVEKCVPQLRDPIDRLDTLLTTNVFAFLRSHGSLTYNAVGKCDGCREQHVTISWPTVDESSFNQESSKRSQLWDSALHLTGQNGYLSKFKQLKKELKDMNKDDDVRDYQKKYKEFIEARDKVHEILGTLGEVWNSYHTFYKKLQNAVGPAISTVTTLPEIHRTFNLGFFGDYSVHCPATEIIASCSYRVDEGTIKTAMSGRTKKHKYTDSRLFQMRDHLNGISNRLPEFTQFDVTLPCDDIEPNLYSADESGSFTIPIFGIAVSFGTYAHAVVKVVDTTITEVNTLLKDLPKKLYDLQNDDSLARETAMESINKRLYSNFVGAHHHQMMKTLDLQTYHEPIKLPPTADTPEIQSLLERLQFTYHLLGQTLHLAYAHDFEPQVFNDKWSRLWSDKYAIRWLSSRHGCDLDILVPEDGEKEIDDAKINAWKTNRRLDRQFLVYKNKGAWYLLAKDSEGEAVDIGLSSVSTDLVNMMRSDQTILTHADINKMMPLILEYLGYTDQLCASDSHQYGEIENLLTKMQHVSTFIKDHIDTLTKEQVDSSYPSLENNIQVLTTLQEKMTLHLETVQKRAMLLATTNYLINNVDVNRRLSDLTYLIPYFSIVSEYFNHEDTSHRWLLALAKNAHQGVYLTDEIRYLYDNFLLDYEHDTNKALDWPLAELTKECKVADKIRKHYNLGAKIDLARQDEFGRTALHVAIQHGYLDFIKSLQLYNSFDLYRIASVQKNELHQGCLLTTAVMAWFADQNTDCEAIVNWLKTQLITSTGHHDVTSKRQAFDYLLAKNAEDIRALLAEKQSILHIAVYYEDFNGIATYLDQADNFMLMNKNNQTPLQYGLQRFTDQSYKDKQSMQKTIKELVQSTPDEHILQTVLPSLCAETDTISLPELAKYIAIDPTYFNGKMKDRILFALARGDFYTSEITWLNQQNLLTVDRSQKAVWTLDKLTSYDTVSVLAYLEQDRQMRFNVEVQDELKNRPFLTASEHCDVNNPGNVAFLIELMQRDNQPSSLCHQNEVGNTAWHLFLDNIEQQELTDNVDVVSQLALRFYLRANCMSLSNQEGQLPNVSVIKSITPTLNRNWSSLRKDKLLNIAVSDKDDNLFDSIMELHFTGELNENAQALLFDADSWQFQLVSRLPYTQRFVEKLIQFNQKDRNINFAAVNKALNAQDKHLNTLLHHAVAGYRVDNDCVQSLEYLLGLRKQYADIQFDLSLANSDDLPVSHFAVFLDSNGDRERFLRQLIEYDKNILNILVPNPHRYEINLGSTEDAQNPTANKIMVEKLPVDLYCYAVIMKKTQLIRLTKQHASDESIQRCQAMNLKNMVDQINIGTFLLEDGVINSIRKRGGTVELPAGESSPAETLLEKIGDGLKAQGLLEGEVKYILDSKAVETKVKALTYAECDGDECMVGTAVDDIDEEVIVLDDMDDTETSDIDENTAVDDSELDREVNTVIHEPNKEDSVTENEAHETIMASTDPVSQTSQASVGLKSALSYQLVETGLYPLLTLTRLSSQISKQKIPHSGQTHIEADYGKWSDDIKHHPRTGQPLFTYHVYRGDKVVGSAVFYAHKLLCRSKDGNHINIVSQSGVLSDKRISQDNIEDICGHLPPSLTEDFIANVIPATKHGVLRGLINSVDYGLQQNGYSQNQSSSITQPLYYGGYFLMQAQQYYALMDDETDILQQSLQATTQAAYDTGSLWLMNQGVQQLGKSVAWLSQKATDSGWIWSGKVLSQVSRATGYLSYVHHAYSQGVPAAVTSVASGYVAEKTMSKSGITLINIWQQRKDPNRQNHSPRTARVLSEQWQGRNSHTKTNEKPEQGASVLTYRQ